MIAMVGRLLSTETTGARNFPNGGSRYAATDKTNAAAKEKKKASSVLRHVAPKARQKLFCPNRFPASRRESEKEGTR